MIQLINLGTSKDDFKYHHYKEGKARGLKLCQLKKGSFCFVVPTDSTHENNLILMLLMLVSLAMPGQMEETTSFFLYRSTKTFPMEKHQNFQPLECINPMKAQQSHQILDILAVFRILSDCPEAK